MRRAASFAAACAALALGAAACTPPPTGGTNTAPTAAATGPSASVTGQRTVFGSAGSTDSDGTIVSYEWDFGDGNTSTDPSASHIYDVSGVYAVTLTVTDDDGASAVDSTIGVTVTDDPAGRYVATTGADAGDCSDSTAKCASIGYAVSQTLGGDSVYVEAGDYPEMVNPDKSLQFHGANSGLTAGVDALAREAETTVQGFRSGTTNTSYQDLTVDGFEIDPTSDPALLTNATGIIQVFGGPEVRIVNNLFTGAHTYVPTCGYTCTDMGDYAVFVKSGAVEIEDNTFVNWRRPVNVIQSDAAFPVLSASISRNDFSGITSRAMSIGQNTGQHTMPGVVVDGNNVDATGRDLIASTPAGITITNDSNQVTNNTFSGFSTGVYMQLCKKWSQQDNVISGNLFANNNAGVNITTYLDTSQCVRGASEGTDGWFVGGGVVDGLQINNNAFVGSGNYAIRFNPNFGTYTPAVSTGPLDATCNWFDDAAGPGGTNDILQGPITNAQVNATPWLTSVGGACDGS
ncbi:MAG: PKD domain-containing protein [Microthrixaceae bacterium]|nr:PKD domain-containing protein [Microthrixaceae bacterium]